MGCICPKCKSNNIIPIMYGYPTHEAFEEAEKGNIKLGGCEVIIGCDMPDRFCKDCEHEWCVDSFLVEDIVKIRFRYWSNWGVNDPESIIEDQWAFEVFPDGTVKYFAYPRVGRRVLDKDKVQIEKERVVDFYQNVIWLYRPWTEIEECMVCDGCSYELTITYTDNRKKKLRGDLGGGTVDKTVTDFLCTIPEMKIHPEAQPRLDAHLGLVQKRKEDIHTELQQMSDKHKEKRDVAAKRAGCKKEKQTKCNCTSCGNIFYYGQYDEVKNVANVFHGSLYSLNQVKDLGKCPKCGSRAITKKDVFYWVDKKGNCVDVEE